MKTAHDLNEEGNELFKQGDYAAAVTLFEQAVQLGGAGMPTYLSNLGHAHAQMQHWEDAIFYTREALRYDPDFELGQQRLAQWLFSFGQQLHRTKKFYQARYQYVEALVYKPLEDSWHSELRKTVIAPKDIPIISLIDFPDTFRDSIHKCVTTLLYFFQEIQQPVKIFWTDEATQQKVPNQKLPNIAHSLPEYGKDGAIVSHTIVLNADHYREATIIEIMGDIAHELAHEAWKARKADDARFVPPFNTDDFTHSSNEWITDLQVLYRGFGTWLLKSREYSARHSGFFAFSEQYRAMKPIEIRRRLRSGLEFQGKQAINLGSAMQKGEVSGDASKEFMKAQRIWQQVIQEDPAYAYGHYELAVVYGWLDNWEKALVHGLQAVELEPINRQFTRYLQQVIVEQDAVKKQKDHGAQLMQQAVSTWETDQKKARELFTQAIKQWEDILADVPSYAFALHEVGVAYYWLGDYDKAIPYFRSAVQFDPNLDDYYRSLGNAYTMMKDHVLAASAYKSAVECNPEYALNHHKLGVSLWWQGKLDLAESSLKDAVDLEPENPEFTNSLNDLQQKLNK